MYSYDPIAHLSAEQVALVLEGEVHLFTERSDPSNLDMYGCGRRGNVERASRCEREE
jgi:hypothetical protein